MRREDLEHIIRASAVITDQYEFVVIGSQSILGQVPNPPEAFTASMEADIYPREAPELADKIDGAIGEGSPFHLQYGYYAEGVGPNTAVLPSDWMSRAHRIQNPNTDLKIGWCLDTADLFLAKAVANRPPKDKDFCCALLEHGYVKVAHVLELVALIPLDADQQKSLRARIRRWVKESRERGIEIPD